MEDDGLIEINKNYLKDIFYKKLSDRESKSISKKQFLKFLQTTKVYPDLVSSLDLKKLFSSVLRNKYGEKIREISYSKYEKLLKTLSKHCFPSENSLKLLITHIKPSCFIHYQVNLITKIQKEVNLLSTTRLISSTRAKISNKTTFDKTLSQKLSLSGIISPRNQTQVKIHSKIGDIRSPSTKTLIQSNLTKNNEKITQLRKIIEKFKLKHVGIRGKKQVKKSQMINLLFSQILSKTGLVIEI